MPRRKPATRRARRQARRRTRRRSLALPPISPALGKVGDDNKAANTHERARFLLAHHQRARFKLMRRRRWRIRR